MCSPLWSKRPHKYLPVGVGWTETKTCTAPSAPSCALSLPSAMACIAHILAVRFLADVSNPTWEEGDANRACSEAVIRNIDVNCDAMQAMKSTPSVDWDMLGAYDGMNDGMGAKPWQLLGPWHGTLQRCISSVLFPFFIALPNDISLLFHFSSTFVPVSVQFLSSFVPLFVQFLSCFVSVFFSIFHQSWMTRSAST